MRTFVLMLLIISSLTSSEEVSVDTFADIYIRLTRAVDQLQQKIDKQSRDLVKMGKERLSHYETFIKESDKNRIGQLIQKCLEHELQLKNQEERKGDIKYAQKLTDRLFELYTQDVNNVLLQYDLVLNAGKRHIIINRDNIDTKSILNNIRSIQYPFSAGEITLIFNTKEWTIETISISSNISETLNSKLLTHFAGQELLNRINGNMVLLNSSQLSSAIDDVIIKNTDTYSETILRYTVTLHPDPGGKDVTKYYAGKASVISKIIKTGPGWLIQTGINEVNMPSRDIWKQCQYCQGTGYTKLQRVTRTEFQKMNEQFASPYMSQMHPDGIEIELPWDIIRQESDYVYVIGYKCQYCKKTGGETQNVADRSNLELNILRQYIKDSMNSQ
ncbi:MAG: hypothetical protein FJ263_07765 [Planctomycetes bacterium]|nr:hypothetical protein [Planctomycetota bacterium]